MDKNSPNDVAMVDTSNTAVAVKVTDTLKDKAIDLIVIMTGSESLFTAYDITQRLRSENKGMDIPHVEVRNMVHQEFNDTFCDEYERTLTELLTGDHSFVYHPENIAATDYHLAVKPVVDDTVDDGVGFPLTDSNRLNIPLSMLNDMTLKPSDKVHIETENGVMSLTTVPATPDNELQVNADGRLRLNSITLTRAFGSLSKKYNIAVSSDKTAITVRPI